MRNLKEPRLLYQSLPIGFDVALSWKGLGSEELQQHCKKLWISVDEQAAAVVCGMLNAASSAKGCLSVHKGHSDTTKQHDSHKEYIDCMTHSVAMLRSPERYGSKYIAFFMVSGLVSNCLPPTFKDTIAAVRRSPRGETGQIRFMIENGCKHNKHDKLAPSYWGARSCICCHTTLNLGHTLMLCVRTSILPTRVSEMRKLNCCSSS